MPVPALLNQPTKHRNGLKFVSSGAAASLPRDRERRDVQGESASLFFSSPPEGTVLFLSFFFLNVRWHRSCSLPHSTSGSPAILRFVGIPPPSPRRVLAHFSSSLESLRHSHICEGATRVYNRGVGDAGVKCEPHELRLFVFFFLMRLCRADCDGGDKTCRTATVSVGRRGRVEEGRGLYFPLRRHRRRRAPPRPPALAWRL